MFNLEGSISIYVIKLKHLSKYHERKLQININYDIVNRIQYLNQKEVFLYVIKWNHLSKYHEF